MLATTEDDGFLSESEREAPFSAAAEEPSTSMAIRNAAELVKTKKRGSEQKGAKRPRTLPAAAEEVRAIAVASAPLAQHFSTIGEQSTGLCMPTVQLWQQQQQPAGGGPENGGSELRGTRSEAPDLQTGNPIQVAFPPEFFDMFRGAMREEIDSYCAEGGFRPNINPNPIRLDRDPEPRATGTSKRPREDPDHIEGGLEDQASVREETEFLSDEEEVDFQLPAPTARFFKQEDYIYLLSKTMSALDLQSQPDGENPEEKQGKWRPKGKNEFFSIPQPTEQALPFPASFETQIKAEWNKPLANKRCPTYIKRLYSLSPYVNEFLQVPVIDAPVAALQTGGLLAEEGHGSLKDPVDKKADFALRKAHESAILAIKSSASASIFSRAAIVWMRKLIQLIPETDHRALEGANRVLKAVSYTADATLDSMLFASRSLASAVAVRRTLWLKAWQTSHQDKILVAGYPFQGDRLFGDALDKILVETREKKKAMPRALRRPDKRPFNFPSFRSQHTLPRFRQDNRKPVWTQNRQSFRKPGPSFRFNKQPYNRPDAGNRDTKNIKA